MSTDYREPVVDGDPRFHDPDLLVLPCRCEDTACFCSKVFFTTLDEMVSSTGDMRCHDCRGELHEWAPIGIVDEGEEEDG